MPVAAKGCPIAIELPVILNFAISIAPMALAKAIGAIDMAKFNITGSSIAIGHPFAATGTRQLTQILYDLKRTGGQHGLITACAAGGLGGSIVVEVA